MGNTARLEFACVTDAGLVRPQNEDAVTLSPAFGFAVLADGMGGYSAGEVASSIATAVIKESMEAALARIQQSALDFFPGRGRQFHQIVTDAVQQANTAIIEAAATEPHFHGMGTTVIVALIHHERLIIAHVGDSRAYRLRRGVLAQITRDHSLLQEQIDAGLIHADMARHSLNRNLITRAVGINPSVDVEIHDHVVEAGDLYLLCSDGLCDMLPDEDIARTLQAGGATLEQTCRALVAQANACGGHDNISVVLIKVEGHLRTPTSLFGRLRNWMT